MDRIDIDRLRDQELFKYLDEETEADEWDRVDEAYDEAKEDE